MSWNIFIYAEVKGNNDNGWKPLVVPAVCDDFKHLNDGFVDSLPCMSAKDVVHPTIKSLNNELYSCVDFKVQYCTVKELRKHYCNVIKNFETRFTAVYLALGIKINLDDDWYDIDECRCEDSNCDNKRNCICDMLDKMSFPINKEMLFDLLSSMHSCKKAYQVLGMCDTIESMCENYDEVRLLFATL